MPKVRKNKKGGAKTAKKAPIVNQNGRPNIGVKPATKMVQKILPTKKNQNVQEYTRKTLHEKVCAITDPFCVNARMSKWPDGQNGASLAYQIRGHASISNFVASAGSLTYISGSLPYSYLTAFSYAASAYTMQVNYFPSPGSSSFVSYAGLYRITSWGVVIRNLLPALTAQGYLTISKQGIMPSPNSVIFSGGVDGSEVETHPLSAGFEVAVIGKSTGTDSRAYQAQDSVTTKKLGWDIIKIEVSGSVPTVTPAIDIEFFYNVEFSLNAGNLGLHQFIPPAPLQSVKLAEAANASISKLGSIATGGVEAVGAKVLSKVASAVEDFAADAFTWLFI